MIGRVTSPAAVLAGRLSCRSYHRERCSMLYMGVPCCADAEGVFLVHGVWFVIFIITDGAQR